MRKYTKRSLQKIDVRAQGRGFRSKMLILLWSFSMLSVFAFFIDFIVNTHGVDANDAELPSWANTVANIIRNFLSAFGEVTVSNAWLVYFTGMIILWFLIFFGFYIISLNPRYLVLGLALSLIAVPFEDYLAQIAMGNVLPNWEGPIKGLGFIGAVPTFYVIFFVPGSILLIVWVFWEYKLSHVYYKIDQISNHKNSWRRIFCQRKK